jgi:hypothetical protein
LKKIKYKNSKGISVIFLIIAMSLMIIIGYVFSYLIPSKQKSVVYPIQSTQAFFIAQSGVEYAVRYAVAHNWRTAANLAGLNAAGVYQKNLGAGRFTINYTNTTDTLISYGEVPIGTEKRRITITNFTTFMQQHLVLDTTYAPCLHYTLAGGNYTYAVYFHILDTDTTGNTILNSFRASWDVDPPTINRVRFTATNRWTGTYSNGAAQTNFATNQTFTPGANIQVRIRWNATTGICDFNNLIVYFYDTNGNEYTFALDPNGIGLTGQTAACP